MAPPLRIVLVEDNDVYRESLELLLGARPGLDVVGSVRTGREAAAACARLAAQVALVDFRLPDMDGAETASAIREASPETGVVLVTAEATPEECERALAGGVAAVVRKDEPVDAMVDVVRRVGEREGVWS